MTATMNRISSAMRVRGDRRSSILATCAALALPACASFRGPDHIGGTQPAYTDVITTEHIEASPNSTTVREILERYVPGFRATGGTRPGGRVSVSLLGMRDPVFVLDGMVLEEAGVALFMDPRDVERIEVLKHGASTALFGFRGSNGAIVITSRGM
jgi:TonB-dependent SusC/RagA subfamily outer membrane receptor